MQREQRTNLAPSTSWARQAKKRPCNLNRTGGGEARGLNQDTPSTWSSNIFLQKANRQRRRRVVGGRGGWNKELSRKRTASSSRPAETSPAPLLARPDVLHSIQVSALQRASGPRSPRDRWPRSILWLPGLKVPAQRNLASTPTWVLCQGCRSIRSLLLLRQPVRSVSEEYQRIMRTGGRRRRESRLLRCACSITELPTPSWPWSHQD
mmetsp:Transcript_4357/g.10534  ORF Transcript_4357/g.10534 Transcript_4357/m.10534 type:complete len:208 (+) Transcript_4357:598-1221(+)